MRNGKTLTSLWIKEALKPKNTIVYVPSLSLLKQTLEEWTKHKSLNFSIKCVCSDQSVSRTAQELDEAIVDVTELGVPVTTNPKEIAEFLSTDKDSIIFSTYQSAPVILEAIKRAGYTAGKDISIAIDAAASEFYKDGKYNLARENRVNNNLS